MEENEELVNLYQLLSEPLLATIDADNEVANRYYAILEKYAFGISEKEKALLSKTDLFNLGKKGISINQKKLQTISFDFINSEGNKQTAEIPLLTLMPLPLLHVSEASFEFDVQMSVDSKGGATMKEELEPITTKSLALRIRLPKTEEVLTKGSPIVEKSSSTNMKVTIKMEQSDMPIGLANILQTAANSLLISKTKEEE